jgi:hypothetical protein
MLDGTGMRFLVVERPPGCGATAQAPVQIGYQLERRPGRVELVRQEGARRTAIGGAHVRDARFELAWTPVGWMLRGRLLLDAEGERRHTVFAVRLAIPS